MTTVDTNNYTIGGVDLYFDPSVAHASLLATTGGVTVGSPFRSTGRNLGNIVTSEITPDVTYVEHFISVKGSRLRDKVAANTKSLTVPFTFDEMNGSNLQKFFLASSLGTGKLAVMEEALIEGSVSLHFQTDIGRDMVYSIPKAVIRPDGALGINTEDWWTGPMIIDVLHYDSGQYASKPYGVVDLSPA